MWMIGWELEAGFRYHYLNGMGAIVWVCVNTSSGKCSASFQKRLGVSEVPGADVDIKDLCQ